MIDERTIRQILLAKYYLHLAAEQMKNESETARFAAINLYHEALETTLITCADHLNAKIGERATIESYLDRINEKLSSEHLPLRTQILQFNKVRVAAKHYLNLPSATYFSRVDTIVAEFVSETVRLCTGENISSVSLVNLIEDREVAECLRKAQDHANNGEFYSSLELSRRAFYLQFEKAYDIRPFSDPEKAKERGLLSTFSFCKAPYFAKSHEYIEKSVANPTDYIVLDHPSIDAELMKDGIDVQVFWNIWRLTPSVYRYDDGNWVTEFDFNIADDPQIKTSCTYVIDSLISVTLQRQARRKQTRLRGNSYRYVQAAANAPIYRKASITSEIVGHLPNGVRRLNVDHVAPPLEGEGLFWRVSFYGPESMFLFGYLAPEDLESGPQIGFIADNPAIPHALSSYLPEADAQE